MYGGMMDPSMMGMGAGQYQGEIKELLYKHLNTPVAAGLIQRNLSEENPSNTNVLVRS